MDRLIDLHAHPYLKVHNLPYLANTFHAYTYSGAHWNPLGFRYQYRNLRRSPVKVLLNAHYVIERGFVLRGVKLPAQAVLASLSPRRTLSMATIDPWKSLLRQMDGLERAITNTNRFNTLGGPRLRLIKHFADIDTLAGDEIAVAHAIEGAHVFGYSIGEEPSPELFWERTKKRLHYLADRGVTMLTLAHFWDQPFFPQTDSTELIPKMKNGRVVRGRDNLAVEMKRATWKLGARDDLGERLLREMLELGIVADLSHMQEHARYAVYDIAAQYGRPVVLSHVGLKRFFDHEYNLSDDEVLRIHKLGGVVGLIFSKRLLQEPIKLYKDDGKGIPLLVDNMRHIKHLTGDVSAIGIGTDFDGMTHPLRDCYNPSQLHRVGEAMAKHFNDEEIDAIFYGNALRLLENGWGARPEAAAKAKHKTKATRRTG